MVQVRGGEFALVTYEDLLSPPPLLPGQEPMPAEAAKPYGPLFEVFYLPDAEVLIPREPDGFPIGIQFWEIQFEVSRQKFPEGRRTQAAQELGELLAVVHVLLHFFVFRATDSAPPREGSCSGGQSPRKYSPYGLIR